MIFICLPFLLTQTKMIYARSLTRFCNPEFHRRGGLQQPRNQRRAQRDWAEDPEFSEHPRAELWRVRLRAERAQHLLARCQRAAGLG